MNKTVKQIGFTIIIFLCVKGYSQISRTPYDSNKVSTYSEWSESDCNCYINSDFFAFINAYTALMNQEATNWLRTREAAFKNEIEDRLNEEFNTFHDAQFEYFKNAYQINSLASAYYDEYRKDNLQRREQLKWEIDKYYTKYKMFDLRFKDAGSIRMGTGSIYDSGGLEYNGISLENMSEAQAYNLSRTNLEHYNGWRNSYSSQLTNYNALNKVIRDKELQEYFANLLISDYKSYSNYKTRIELMLNYLVWDFQRGNLLQLPPAFPNRYPLENFDYSNVVSNLISNSNVPYVDYSDPNYSIEKIKTLFVINEMFNDNSRIYVDNNPELISYLQSYFTRNNFKKNNIDYINDYFRRYVGHGFMTDDDRINGVYESTNKSFQTEDKPEFVLTLKLSRKGMDEGLLGIASILEYMSFNGTRKDFEGHLIALILSENGVSGLSQNFSYEELATLFDFYSVQPDYIKIRFSSQIKEYLNYDEEYGTSIFTNPLKIQMLQVLAANNTSDTNAFIGQIDTFLRQHTENGVTSQEAEAFAQEVIEIWEENPDAEVDFEDRIIRDNSFDNEPCFKDNLDLLSISSIASDYFDNFEGEYPVAHLKFTASSFGNNKYASTYAPQNFVIEIRFNTDKTNRPNTDIARTIMHEVLHAEIFRKLLSLAQAGNLSGLTEQDIIDAKDDYPGIYDYYTRYIYNNPNPSSPQHDMMAQHMIETLTNFLMQFDNSLSYSEAEALAWTGLKRGVDGDQYSEINPQTGLVVDPVTGANESTVAWTNLTQAERLNINQIRSNYMQNTTPCQ